MTLILSGTDGLSDVDGSASTPAIRGTDANTGIFFPAADTIAFAEGGAEAMRIDSSGNVLVGTTTATNNLRLNAKLGVVSTGSGNLGGMSITSYSGTTAGDSSFFDFQRSRGTTDGSLTIVANNDVLGYLIFRGSNGTGFSDAAYITASVDGTPGASNDMPGRLTFSTSADGSASPTERMRIDSSGNVQIGTTTSKHTIFSGSGNGLTVGGASAPTIAVYDTTNTSMVGYLAQSEYDTYLYNGANGFLAFGTNNTERARITSGGYFKASNDGTYNVATGTYHEFRQTANSPGLLTTNTNASFANSAHIIRATRSASTAYYFSEYGSGDGADNEFLMRGDGNAYADGTWNNNGADYAEFFESANGQALTLGATVVLDGNKVREATEQDPASAIIGVVRPKEPSKASMVVGNTAWNKWANKYLTDDFDRYIMEDHDVVEWEEQVLEREAVEAVVDEEGNEVSPAQEDVYKTKQHSYESHNIPEGITVPADATRKTHDDKGNKFQHYKLNPAWDKDAEYVNRENRPEWNIIGLVGQVKVLKGQPTNDRWVKMRDVSATVEEWFIR